MKAWQGLSPRVNIAIRAANKEATRACSHEIRVYT